MQFADKTVVITGGASGIGAGLASQLMEIGAHVVIADRDAVAVQAVSERLGCAGFVCDVAQEEEIRKLVRYASDAAGPIDCFVSNAGLFDTQPGHAASAPDTVWMQNWNVHVMSHVYAARALLPDMLARGAGQFINVASAAGLLNQIQNAAYSATKQAAVSFAESLAITHGDAGIDVAVVCPQYVATPLIGLQDSDVQSGSGLLSAQEVARLIIAGVEERRFLILPHPEVGGFVRLRAQDHDKWIVGMKRLRATSLAKLGVDQAAHLYRLL
ncbi:D-beta-hydroxybutyrate dehydrogenase [Roseobacter fucihabitans]|uniref:D-beta-hydroxybutyrate dehydrogenase n=1 Tax=Roseobacter fucihabitans TaxID=1537242 RepID=A0ABZ2BZ75_9RHOB|nr:SDR family NAD(P)-dependent oxidoreductase [Roseobacter litoralis]MBC6963853.1 D-beta-hydroxybutyrate dehydrogenase [Roseobacter litoralis]MBC6964062.1 D-beta-hydroxybutyrate dehydrogenase [Roseobacter litoralis]